MLESLIQLIQKILDVEGIIRWGGTFMVCLRAAWML